MSRNEILLSNIEKVNKEALATAFKNVVAAYTTPAYGSITKRDIDILLFMELQKLGIIDKEPQLYDIIRLLRVTRSKARTLLYEANLRRLTTDDLNTALKSLLSEAMFIGNDEYIGLEIGNPFLIDHLKAILRQLGHITDGSFSPELVRLKVDAYTSLIQFYLEEDNTLGAVEQALIAAGAAQDASVKGVLSTIIKSVLQKHLGTDAGEVITTTIGQYIGPVIAGSIDRVQELVSGWFTNE